jgi:hypothetical protein
MHPIDVDVPMRTMCKEYQSVDPFILQSHRDRSWVRKTRIHLEGDRNRQLLSIKGLIAESGEDESFSGFGGLIHFSLSSLWRENGRGIA